MRHILLKNDEIQSILKNGYLIIGKKCSSENEIIGLQDASELVLCGTGKVRKCVFFSEEVYEANKERLKDLPMPIAGGDKKSYLWIFSLVKKCAGNSRYFKTGRLHSFIEEPVRIPTVTKSTLKTNGWTEKAMHEYLPEPIRRNNPHYSSAAQMCLWYLDIVEKAEKAHPEFFEKRKVEKQNWIKEEMERSAKKAELDRGENTKKKSRRANIYKEKKKAVIMKRKDDMQKEQLILQKMPKDVVEAYPLARNRIRHFAIHVGPTNSGKTYAALQELYKARSGIYLAPLRLLAHEVYGRMNEDGMPCSLLTGEEQREIPGAKHISATVEMLDIDDTYDVAVIDEAQMLGDKERGAAWTNAILGV